MNRHRKRLGKLLAATGVAFALAPAVAQAAIDHTNVTSAGTPFGFGNDNRGGAPTNTRTVTGTSDGTPNVDQVDIRCEAPGTDVLLASGVTVGTGGAFSTTIGTTDFEGDLCRIVAVPAGQVPADLTTFTGPVVGNGNVESMVSNSRLYDYYISQPQSGAFNDYLSLGSCGLCDSALYGPKLLEGQYLWYDNAAIYKNTYTSGGVPYPYAQVDGVDVYSPREADESTPGAPVLRYTHKVNRTSGNMTITEVDPLVKCSPSSSSCTSYVSAGLAFYRTIEQTTNGRVVRITDVIHSTDGKAHTFTFAYDEFQDGSAMGFRFPGQSAYAERSDGDTETFGSAPVQTIHLIDDLASAPSIINPVGTLTVSPAPTVARFSDGSPAEGFDMVFTGSIPAGGSKTVRQYFGMAPTQAQANRYTYENVNAMVAPVVRITRPAANGSTVHTAQITVTGTATDNRAVISLTVNGRRVALSHGSFSTTVSLTKGPNRITVVARDGAGNRTVAARTVTYAPPHTKKS